MDINELRGQTYATVRRAFNSAGEICYEYGDMGSVNNTGILTRIIQDVGRLSESWSSDALINLERLRQLSHATFVLDRPFDEIVTFGIHRDGVDHMGYLMNRLLETMDRTWGYIYPERMFRRILAVRIRAHRDEEFSCTRVDFSLRDIMNTLHGVEDADLMPDRASAVPLPFPGGTNPEPASVKDNIDLADIRRIMKNGYVRFEAVPVPASVIDAEGTCRCVACTAIYGRYPDNVPRKPRMDEDCVCRVYRFGNGQAAVCWLNRLYMGYEEAIKLVDEAKMETTEDES